jgi:ParB/RepB/Spo0J family partition protein
MQVMQTKLIKPSTTNGREIRPAELKELAASMKERGLLQPLLVRPSERGDFELVCGHRRLLAAQSLGWTSIAVTVRGMSDEEARKAQLVENLQRQDLHPMEEAELISRLMAPPGMRADKAGAAQKPLTIRDVAQAIGRSPSVVAARQALLNLAPSIVKKFKDGKLTLRAASMLARIPDGAAQVEILDQVEQHNGNIEELAKIVAREGLHDLGKAPFDVKDATLVKAAGACGACPFRSGNQPELFGDVKNGETCTKPSCWVSKCQASGTKALAAAEAKGIRVLAGSDGLKQFAIGYQGRVELRHGGKFADLAEETYLNNGANITRGAALDRAKVKPEAVGLVLAMDPHGVVHRLVDAAKWDAATRKVRNAGSGSSHSSGSGESPAAVKARHLKQHAYKAAYWPAADALAAALKRTAPLKTLRAYVEIDGNAAFAHDDVPKECKAYRAAGKARTTITDLAVALLLGRVADGPEHMGTEFGADIKGVAKMVGVDLGKFLKAATVALKPKETKAGKAARRVMEKKKGKTDGDGRSSVKARK